MVLQRVKWADVARILNPPITARHAIVVECAYSKHSILAVGPEPVVYLIQ